MKAYLILILLTIILTSCINKNKLSDAYGNFEAKEILVTSEANGKLMFFKIEEGQQIKEGEITGLVDTLQTFLKKAQVIAQLGQIKAKYESVQAQSDVQEKQKEILLKELDRLKNLLRDGAATSKQMDDLTGQLGLLGKQINATKTQFLAIESEKNVLFTQFDQIQDQLSRCKIVNPINGTILEKYVEPGELVTMGRNLYKLADIENMELRIYVSGSQLSQIKIGQVVKVFIDESKKKNKELIGTISWISSLAEFTPKIIQTKEERVNLVYAVKVRVKNDGSLKIGMPGEVVFN